jgi:hypothetical protein
MVETESSSSVSLRQLVSQPDFVHSKETLVDAFRVISSTILRATEHFLDERPPEANETALHLTNASISMQADEHLRVLAYIGLARHRLNALRTVAMRIEKRNLARCVDGYQTALRHTEIGLRRFAGFEPIIE